MLYVAFALQLFLLMPKYLLFFVYIIISCLFICPPISFILPWKAVLFVPSQKDQSYVWPFSVVLNPLSYACKQKNSLCWLAAWGAETSRCSLTKTARPSPSKSSTPAAAGSLRKNRTRQDAARREAGWTSPEGGFRRRATTSGRTVRSWAAHLCRRRE